MTLGGAITKITLAAGETAAFSVRVPQEGSPQYIYDDDPDNGVDVPPEIVAEAQALVEADVE